MTDDARFEDGGEAPLNLGALDAEDLQVISSLVQDAVFPASEMSWDKRAGRFALLLNRMRWEDDGASVTRLNVCNPCWCSDRARRCLTRCPKGRRGYCSVLAANHL